MARSNFMRQLNFQDRRFAGSQWDRSVSAVSVARTVPVEIEASRAGWRGE